jgi:hypothetical protein
MIGILGNAQKKRKVGLRNLVICDDIDQPVLEDIILNKANQAQRETKTAWSLSFVESKRVDFMKVDRIAVTRGGDRKMQRDLSTSTIAQIWRF